MPPRHCERSEAIHAAEERMDCFVASLPCANASRLSQAMTAYPRATPQGIPMRFDLVDLQLFVAVAETRSITNGAGRVHLALASASERIKGLEEALGVALLTRGRRGVDL